mgnify:CR=1 FL=1
MPKYAITRKLMAKNKVDIKKFGDRFDEGFIEIVKPKKERPLKQDKPTK